MKYRINHSKVVSQADIISDKASELNQQIKELERIEESCRSVWKGQAAETFQLKLKELHKEIAMTKKQMTELASIIKSCADQIQKEDQEREKKASTL